jgi:hypothetical protein
MKKNCNDNLYVKPIEFCSIDTIKKLYEYEPEKEHYKIDSNTNYIKTSDTKLTDIFPSSPSSSFKLKFRNDTNNEYLDIKSNEKLLCGKTNKEDEYYMNCVIETQNPLFSYNNGYCTLHQDFNLPDEFKKIEKDDEIFLKINRNKLNDEEGNFKYNKIKNEKYCEDKWYDWIVIPNYHFGNRILKDKGKYSKEDVKICYNNCRAGELPYINSNGSNLCIPKEIAYEGKYEKKLDYSPIALINLIGNNKKHLSLLYNNLFLYKINQKIDKFDFNKDNLDFYKILSTTDNYIINEAFDKIKNILNNIVNDNNLDIPDYSFEYRHLTYKHPYFKENDLMTLLGMEKNEILSNDIILIHTAYLAYKYKFFIYNIKNDINFLKKTDSNGNDIDINKNNDFNLNNTLNELEIITKYTDLINKDKINTDITSKKRQRLANILYKAINICYDNKTDFSKNIINRTKEAFNNYQYKFFNNIDFLINKLTSPNKDPPINEINKKEYDNFIINDKNNIINGFEVEYYNKDNLDILYNNIAINNFFEIQDKDDNWYNEKSNQYKDFLFYTEEKSELIYKNKCKNGEFLLNNKCVKCINECNSKELCKNNTNCKIYCSDECNKNEDKLKSITKCGGTLDEENRPIKEKTNEIKTPIEEETIIPDFSYIFKTAIKIFFILIVLYIGYMFYTIFNESILTFANGIFIIFDWLWFKITFKDNIKKAEYYENIIQDKYNRIIRKTMI